jgi:catechol 2,3-dioxygenase-like lactoylglutathione lyase family enzyme
MLRFDHIGVVVDDLDAVTDFFVALGFELENRWPADGEELGKIVGLAGARTEAAMVRAPDGSGKLELVKFVVPADPDGVPAPQPANRPGFRHIAVEIKDLATVVDRLRGQGFATVGEVVDFAGAYRLCYVHGPEGLIVELAEKLD